MDSPGFNNWVRKIHAKINQIPYQEFPNEGRVRNLNAFDYKPTTWHKVNAFRIIWFDEIKRSLKIW